VKVMIVSDGALEQKLDRLAEILVPDALVQVREKHLAGRALLALVTRVVAMGARVLVNDRLDVALAAGASGVQLPERGLPVGDARALAPRPFLVGASRHDLDGARAAAAAGADLIVLGPIWETPGKGAPLGLAALTAARADLPAHVELCAIGGIDSPERAAAAAAAGADRVAAIRAYWHS
jgi:thiamine-phosphate pyrophosphorylase